MKKIFLLLSMAVFAMGMFFTFAADKKYAELEEKKKKKSQSTLLYLKIVKARLFSNGIQSDHDQELLQKIEKGIEMLEIEGQE